MDPDEDEGAGQSPSAKLAGGNTEGAHQVQGIHDRRETAKVRRFYDFVRINISLNRKYWITLFEKLPAPHLSKVEFKKSIANNEKSTSPTKILLAFAISNYHS